MDSSDQLAAGFFGLIFLFILLPGAICFLSLVLFSAIMEIRSGLRVHRVGQESGQGGRSRPPAKFWVAFGLVSLPIGAVYYLNISDRLSHLLLRAVALVTINQSVSDVVPVLLNALLYLGTSLVLLILGTTLLFAPLFVLLVLGDVVRRRVAGFQWPVLVGWRRAHYLPEKLRASMLAVIATGTVALLSGAGIVCMVIAFIFLVQNRSFPTMPPVSFVPEAPAAHDSVRQEWASVYVGTAATPYSSPGDFGGQYIAPIDIGLDHAGNVFVIGNAIGGKYTDRNTIVSSPVGYAVIKYSPDGSEQWVATYNGLGGEIGAVAGAVDSLGNVYVTGSSKGEGTGKDYVTIKYAPDGTSLWVANYSSSGDSADGPNKIAVDHEGNVYLTGSTARGTDNEAITTVKYSPNGSEVWVSHYRGIGTRNLCTARELTTDIKGNLYITGACQGTKGNDRGYVIVKYDSVGIQQWSIRQDVPDNGQAEGLAVDSNENVYVTSFSTSSNQCSTVKYGTDGKQLWTALYEGLGTWTWCNLTVVDEGGHLYVGGGGNGGEVTGTGTDYVIVKYLPDGREIWTARYDGPAHSNDQLAKLAVDGDGNIYVAGTSWGEREAGDDYSIVKYGPDGSLKWVVRFNTNTGSDTLKSLVVDEVGNIYVTGSTGMRDTTTIKYSQSVD